MLKKASSELEKKIQNAQTKQDSSHMFVNKGFSNLPLPMISENQKFKIQAPTAANLKNISEKKAWSNKCFKIAAGQWLLRHHFQTVRTIDHDHTKPPCAHHKRNRAGYRA